MNDVSDLDSVKMRITGRKLEHGMRPARSVEKPPGNHPLPHSHHALLAIDEDDVDRSSHEAGVDRRAARKEERRVREITLAHETRESPAERERDFDAGENVASNQRPPFP